MNSPRNVGPCGRSSGEKRPLRFCRPLDDVLSSATADKQKDSGSIVMSLNSSARLQARPSAASRYPFKDQVLAFRTSDEFRQPQGPSEASPRDLKLGNPGQKETTSGILERLRAHRPIKNAPYGHRSRFSPASSKATSSGCGEQLGRYMQIQTKNFPRCGIEAKHSIQG